MLVLPAVNTAAKQVFLDQVAVSRLDACCDAWLCLRDEPGRIRSLCNYPSIAKAAS